MQKDKYLIIPNKKDLTEYTNKGFNSFILPLINCSVGFDIYFTVEEINELSEKYSIYVMINKFMHRNIEKFKNIYIGFNKSIKFFVEDIGLLEVIDMDKVVLYEKNILSNYSAINYLNTLDIDNVVINNDLTIDEIIDIRNNTKSKLYYFVFGKNNIMYSRRTLITNYNKHFNCMDNDKEYVITEKASDKELYIKEEDESSIIYNNKFFCANKYIDKLKDIDYLIINTTFLTSEDEKIVLDNYDSEKLVDLINVDYYFLENKIMYKVGDL